MLLAAVTTASGLILLATLIFVLFKTPIIATWPKTLEIYYRLGLADLQPEGKIVLQNVRSRNAYRDGAMHLVVEGDIRNNAKKTQILHALQFKARGPDGAIIESWRIDPPTATLRPGAAVSFATAILSPKKTVVEVNLDFVEPPHDER